MPVLQNLQLHHNLLSALPTELGKATSLNELALHNNRLTALPAELGALVELSGTHAATASRLTAWRSADDARQRAGGVARRHDQPARAEPVDGRVVVGQQRARRFAV